MTQDPAAGRPRLSVVVPARNSAPWIGELLESVLVQAVPDTEVVVVDNGSTDETAALLRAITAPGVDVRVVRTGAGNAGAARNVGVAAARGEYLVFADADDIVPAGAYRSMVGSLDASGSDMVIGDHLKFSPTRTWSPTARWWSFDRPVVGARPEEVPQLLAGRACWNRMFRRSFWDSASLRFPELPNLEDVLPMTEAFVRARSVDVLTECVYLYRDRSDGTSLSHRPDLGTTLRYFEQERRCAAETAGSDVLRRQHAEIVVDADGWAHLERFLRAGPSTADVVAVAAAARGLFDVLEVRDLDAVPAQRRALWLLLLHGEWDAARSFAASALEEATGRVGSWITAVVAVAGTDSSAASALVAQGLVPALVNGAEDLDTLDLASRLQSLGRLPVGEVDGDLARATAAALANRDVRAVRDVSRLRRMVPLVVSAVRSSPSGLHLSGPATVATFGRRCALVLEGPTTTEVTVQPAPTGTGWSADIRAADLPDHGRHRVYLVVDGLVARFPVVTARMTLPPDDPSEPLRPLADRSDGWRFLVDRRAEKRSSLTSFAGRVRRRLRRPHER